jgi:transposase
VREAGIEVRIVDPKRVRSFAKSAGRLAKNDAIDAEMIAWFAETFPDAPGQTYDAAREKLVQIVNARQRLLDLQTSLQNSSEHSTPDCVFRQFSDSDFGNSRTAISVIPGQGFR